MNRFHPLPEPLFGIDMYQPQKCNDRWGQVIDRDSFATEDRNVGQAAWKYPQRVQRRISTQQL